MTNPVQNIETLGHGIMRVTLPSWDGVSLVLQPTTFTQVVYETGKDWPSINLDDYIWRGQRDEFEGLLPTLYRGQPTNHASPSVQEAYQFREFKYALRGRCSFDLDKAKENDVWALGQEHGLHTPLLDWTESPYVALYFAFHEPRPDTPPWPWRYVYGLNRPLVKRKVSKLDNVFDYEGKEVGVFQFVAPLVHDNPHLVSQKGLFTRLRRMMSIQDWIKEEFDGREAPANVPVLLILKILEVSRRDCLEFLDRWNINHLTLFPDVRGAAIYSNRQLWKKVPGGNVPYY